MTFVRLDEEAGEAEMKASGQDVSGRGGADMTMLSRVTELDSGGVEVTVVSEVIVMGLLAQLGRGMIQDVSDVLFEQFTTAMRSELEGADEAEEAQDDDTGDLHPESDAAPRPEPESTLDAVDFGARVARRALLRRLSSPRFWIGIAIVAALIWWLLR